jgi:hypothetical protein
VVDNRPGVDRTEVLGRNRRHSLLVEGVGPAIFRPLCRRKSRSIRA